MESLVNPITKDALHDWVESETRALDVVASWETLCDVYHTLEFSDPLTDAMRMEEFKWIIGEMNKHLKRARNKLLNCTDPESMKETLAQMFTSNQMDVTTRQQLTYHKLRQMWIGTEIAKLDQMIGKENEDGGTDFWNE
jgi:hypothetical protein